MIFGKASPGRLWRKRLAWFVVFWLLGVAALGLIALALRALMNLAGLTT